MIESIIDIKVKKVKELMKPANKMFSLDIQTNTSKLLGQNALELWKYSWIPVYRKNKNQIIGILLIWSLLGVDISENKTILELIISR